VIEQRTPEWHEQRAGRLTASIAGAALGLAPYLSEQDARDIINGVSEFEGNVATDYGTIMEPQAIACFEMAEKLTVTPMPFVSFGDWSGGSPDGRITDGMLLEVKCPYGLRNDTNFDNVKPISEQQHYYAQVQLCMHFAKASMCAFVTYVPQAGAAHEVVAYDSAWIEENMPKLKSFWDDARRLPSAILKEHVTEYLKKKSEIEILKAEMSDIMESIVIEANGKPCRIGDYKLALSKRKGSISYAKALKSLNPDADLEQWRGKNSESWSIK